MGQSGVPLKSSRYPYSVIPGHPLAHADGRVRIHRAVLYDAIGPGAHPCHWCGDLLTWKENLVVDHLDGDTWNNDISNLVASCPPCNRKRAPRRPPRKATHCTHGHEFTPENTYVRPDGTGRQCRACARRRDAEKRARRRKPEDAT